MAHSGYGTPWRGEIRRSFELAEKCFNAVLSACQFFNLTIENNDDVKLLAGKKTQDLIWAISTIDDTVVKLQRAQNDLLGMREEMITDEVEDQLSIIREKYNK